MNEYCKHTIKRFYDLFNKREFDQDDVAFLFVVARDYFSEGDIIKELGDFIAHPKLKTKGMILKNIKGKAIPQFDKFLDKFHRGNVDITKLPRIDLLGSDEVIRDELIEIFSLAGIECDQIDLEDNRFRDFIFCTIFLLGNYKLDLNGTILEMTPVYSHSLTLQVTVKSSKWYSREFAVIPILQLRNVWTDCVRVLSSPEFPLQNHIARRFSNGNDTYIAAISFDRDIGKEFYNPAEFKRGECWPSPVKE